MNKLGPWILAVALVLPALASAQEEGGRTDGPEGSEVGYGGYSRVGGNGRFSLQLDFGAGFPAAPRTVPLLFGVTGSFWADDWFVLDASVMHIISNRTQVFVGPRFRTITYPVSLSIGVKAGPMIFPGAVAFGLAPQLGADIVMGRHILLGLTYALDVAFFSTPQVGHRVSMDVGYRF